MSDDLLSMDVERLLHLGMALLALLFLVKGALRLHTRSRRTLPRLGAALLLVGITALLGMELLLRGTLYAYHDEVNFLLYPLRSYTRDHYFIEWTPPYLLENNSGVTRFNVPAVYRQYQGLTYYKATHNTKGFRYDNIRLPEEGMNLVALGGSSTYGYVSDGETYPDALGRALEKEDIHVFNLGQRGAVLGQYAAALQNTGLDKLLTIDLAVLYTGHNDAGSHHHVFDAFRNMGQEFYRLTQTAPILRYSLLARNGSILLGGARARQVYEAHLNKSIPAAPDLLAQSHTFLQSIHGLAQYLKSVNPDIKILLVPEYVNFLVTSLEFKQQHALKDLSDPALPPRLPAYQVILYDMLAKEEILQKAAQEIPQVWFLGHDFFAEHAGENLLLDTVHLTPRGNTLLAQQVAGFIRKEMLR